MSTPPNTLNPQESGPTPPNFVAVLRQMLRASDKVSDLIFSPGRPPQIELAGKLQPVAIPGLEKLTPIHTASIAKAIIGNHPVAGESLEKTGSADLSFSVPGDARFRVNIFRQRGTHAIVMLSLIHISEPTRLLSISYAVFCLKKKKKYTGTQDRGGSS